MFRTGTFAHFIYTFVYSCDALTFYVFGHHSSLKIVEKFCLKREAAEKNEIKLIDEKQVKDKNHHNNWKQQRK